MNVHSHSSIESIDNMATGTTKILAIVAVAIVALAGVVAAAMVLMKEDDSNTITVATSPDFPPYDYTYKGEFAGIDMDIVRAVCKDMGYNVKFVNVNFDSVVLSVSSGKYKMGASGITINDERAQKVLFSDAYVSSQQVILSKDTYTSASQLEGKKIGVQNGTTGALYADEAFPSAVTHYTTYTDAVSALTKGSPDIDVIVMDKGPAEAFAKKNAGLKVSVVDLGLKYEDYGFIFNLEDKEFKDKFNASLKKLVDDGTIQKILDYYEDSDGDKAPYPFESRIGSASAGLLNTNSNEGVAPSTISLSSAEAANDDKSSFIDDFNNTFIKNDRYKYIIDGLKNTIIITIIALFLGLIVGILLAIVRSIHDMLGKLKVLNAVCKLYITVIRGTPVVVQLLIIYFIIFATSTLNPIIVASIAFGMNSAAYVAEIVRAGINAVPKGQLEAGSSLGLPFSSTMVLVILPQAIKNILPALCNEGITLLKETSISGYIGIMDLTKAGDIIRGQTFEAFLPLIGVALIYLVIVIFLTYLVGRLERRLNANAV